MRIRFTRHAQERMNERHLTRTFVLQALSSPDATESSARFKTRFIAKKFYHVSRLKQHLLLIVYEERLRELLVITIIDTSKIDKYS